MSTSFNKAALMLAVVPPDPGPAIAAFSLGIGRKVRDARGNLGRMKPASCYDCWLAVDDSVDDLVSQLDQ